MSPSRWPRWLIPPKWMVIAVAVGLMTSYFLRDAPWWIYYPALLIIGLVFGFGVSQHEEWRDLRWRRREQWTEDEL